MLKLVLFISPFFLFISCKKDDRKKDTNYTYELSRLQVEYTSRRTKLIEELKANYSDYHNTITSMTILLQTSFLTDAKNRWADVYGSYISLQPYAYSSNSVSNLLILNKNRVDVTGINAAYIDSTYASPSGGIIDNTAQYPNFQDIVTFHQVGGEKNASLGFHVIEFLLWGEDTGVGNTNRPISEFASFYPNGARRGDFLRYSSNQLRMDFNSFDNYENDINAYKSLSV